jgi:dihydrodipicolinate synthase/N-acetylneuraminate lyase
VRDDVTVVMGDDQLIWGAFCIAEDIGTISTACSMFPALVRAMRELATARNESGQRLQDTLTTYKQEVIRTFDYLVGQQATAQVLRESGGYNPYPMASPTEQDIAYARDVLLKLELVERTA